MPGGVIDLAGPAGANYPSSTKSGRDAKCGRFFAGASVRDVALLVSGRRGGGGQESGNKLRHGLADHQCHRLLQVSLVALLSVMPFPCLAFVCSLVISAHSIHFYFVK